ncbi:MAG: carboxylesterase family protein [Verrucomicrobiales bacterium]|nr:carboxylesterase family protein [Verrucomicrobiales bacterium]
MIFFLRSTLFLFVCLVVTVTSRANEEGAPRVLVHFMPWYSVSAEGNWGWHWTMNHFDPHEIRWDGRRKIASHDYPLIGPYDSGNEEVLQCQILQMKFAGIDGVIIDWYGMDQENDYPMIHERTRALVSMIEKAGMEFAICYEDQAVGQIAKKRSLSEEKQIEVARGHLRWVEENWFSRSSYVTHRGKPLLLVFGPQHFEPESWKKVVSNLESSPEVLVLPHLRKDSEVASGIFAWPPVDGGKAISADEWRKRLEAVYEGVEKEESLIPVAFPGFHDIYEQAGLHESYGRIDDRYGATFRESLDLAMEQEPEIIQIATWNDYGEGTVIEPTQANGYRFLEELQRRFGSEYSPMDLRLPERLFRKQYTTVGDGRTSAKLAEVSRLLFESECTAAASLLDGIYPVPDSGPAVFSADWRGDRDSRYHLTTDILYREEEKLTDYEKTRCRLDVYHPAKGAAAKGEKVPVVVWFHGGGISKGHRTIPVPLRNQGVIVVAANYRLSPMVKSPDYIEDAVAAVAWTFQNIESFGGDPDSIFLSGHSAGGYLASMVGFDPRYLKEHGIDANNIAGLIPFSGHSITHFTIRKERGIGGKQAVVDELAPLFHVKKEAPPTLLITGDRELEIYGRYEETAYFWRMMQEVGHPDTTLAELEGYDHGAMPEPAFPLLLSFMKRISK